MAIRIEPARSPTRCPLCHEELAGLPTGRCHSCATTFHQECLEELGGCPTSGCAQRGLVPLDVDRPSACPACGEGVPGDSYDCICGGRYHLECVHEGCIRPGCRMFGLALGGRPRPFPWRRTAHQLSIAAALAATVAVLYTLLVSENPDTGLGRLVGAGMWLVLMAIAVKWSGTE